MDEVEEVEILLLTVQEEEVHPSSRDIPEQWLSCPLVIPLNRERREKRVMELQIVQKR
jgi:hypothetical protein